MKLTAAEVQFLSRWAQEEWQPECYRLPAHRLQLANRVRGAQLIDLIKAWTKAEGKKDKDILAEASEPDPLWPWGSDAEFNARVDEANAQGNRTLGSARTEF